MPSHATLRRRKGRRRKRKESAETADGAAAVASSPSPFSTARKRARSGANGDTLGQDEAAAGVLAFEACYRRQFEEHGVLFPGEWGQLMDWLHRPLPVTFRFTKRLPRGTSLRRTLDSISTARRAYGEGEPKRLPWGDGWQLGFHKKQLKTATGRYAEEVRTWLTQRASSGCVVRQEAVSMLPVIVLDVKPGHRCADLCAAPGSKTTQLLEASAGGAGGGGLVVANDVSEKRAYALVRRCGVLAGSAAHLLVLTHRAQTIPDGVGSFDRIVCDVPCCGDGTLRKEPGIWKRWSPNFGTSLHTLQLQIAMRGISLLKVGGKMVYSTCTFNPLENEAVVAELLRRCGGAVQLVDASARVPRVQWRAGMPSWKVAIAGVKPRAGAYPAAGGITFVDSYDESAATMPSEVHKRMRRSMWPPSPGPGAPDLTHCMRFLPHLHNTGGFFVAVLVKRSALKASPTRVRPSALAAAPSTQQAQSGAALLRGSEPCGRKRWGGVPLPFLRAFFAPFFAGGAESAVLERFAQAVAPNLWGAPPYYRSVVLVTPALRAQMQSERVDDAKSPLRLVAFGAKVLISPTERKNVAPAFRELTPFGVTLLVAMATRTVEVSGAAARALLAPVIASAQRDRHYVELSSISATSNALSEGPCIVRATSAAGSVIAFGGWVRDGARVRATVGERGKGREGAPQAEALLLLEQLDALERVQNR